MKYKIRSINVCSVVRFSFIYFFLLGIIFDILFISFFGLPPKNLSLKAGAEKMGLPEAMLIMISFAVTFGFVMSIFSGFGTLVYNLTSSTIGGICLKLRPDDILDTDPVTTIKTPIPELQQEESSGK